MFQYSYGRSYAIKNSYELSLDNFSGFITDFSYRRKFELEQFPLIYKKINFKELVIFWLFRIKKKFFKKTKLNIFNLGEKNNEFRFENENSYDKSLLSSSRMRRVWFIGYYQTPKYFEKINNIILKELKPPTPKIKKYIDIGKLISQVESVALGIRLYEESNHPEYHIKDRKFKTENNINKVIKKILLKKPNAKFFVFSMKRSALINKLLLPEGTIFLTNEDGYEGTTETMWLLSKCKHHIFTVSSYYWWGAWLSNNNHNKNDQLIYAAKNSINKDMIPNHWYTF